MDRSRKENREGHEKTFQYKSRQVGLLDDELIEDKLTQLLAFVGEMEKTPAGTAEIQRRVKLFGECKRGEGETSAEFYAKLHHWLHRDIAQTKSPLHPPRQTQGGSTS
jgi:hypothetical protein